MSLSQLLNLNLDNLIVLAGLIFLLITALRAARMVHGQIRRAVLVAVSLLVLSVLLGAIGATLHSAVVTKTVIIPRLTASNVAPIVSLIFLARVILLLVAVSILVFSLTRFTAISSDRTGLYKWSWGGFVLAPIWGVFNRVYYGLLALVPIFGFYVAIYLGIHGRELAWNRSSRQTDGFQRAQRNWDVAAIVVLLLGVVLLILRLLG